MDSNDPKSLPADLAGQLDALESGLPELIRANPDPADFWEAFLAVADPLEAQARTHQGGVQGRIAAMLVVHGRFLVVAPLDED